MAEELKPRSFRIDDATAERFKEISKKIEGNQQETLAKLIETYEFQSGKAILTDKAADIGEFEKYVTILTRMYMSSLEDNQNITATVRTEFDAFLQSKDDVIRNLQEQLNQSKQMTKEAREKEKQMQDENKQLTDTITGLQTALTDKDDKNQILSDLCNNLQSQVNAMQEAAAQTDVLQEQVKNLEDERDKAIREYTALQEQMKQVQQQAQFAMDKALLDADRAHQEQLQQTINEYQSQYLQLLKQLHSQAIPSSSDDTQGGQ